LHLTNPRITSAQSPQQHRSESMFFEGLKLFSLEIFQRYKKLFELEHIQEGSFSEKDLLFQDSASVIS
jgi:hypothetical protein